MKADSNEQLLPCPFCGYEASISEVESAGGNGRIIHIVGCNSEDCDVSFHGHARKVDAAKAWNSRFATAEITPYREAFAVMQTALEHYAAKEKWRHDHPVSIEPMREHLHGSNCLKRAYIGNRHGWEVADKALADAAALLEEK